MDKKPKTQAANLTPLRKALKGANLPIGEILKVEDEGTVYLITATTDEIGDEEIERMRRRMKASILEQKRGKVDEKVLTKHFAEFGEEDRQLAEMGMADYVLGLLKEDQK